MYPNNKNTGFELGSSTVISSNTITYTSPEEVRKPSEIEQELNSLNVAMDYFSNILKSLEDKVSPICPQIKDSDGILTDNNKVSEPRVTLLGQQLSGLNYSLSNRFNRLNNIINRIQL